MTGNKCAAYSCDNNYYSSHKNRKNHIFHSFPKGKDLASQTLREKWVKFCRRVDKFNPNTSRICSDHFVNSDYERDLQNELLGLPLKRILKKTAVPTVHLCNDELKLPCSPYQKEKVEAKNKRQIVAQIFNDSASKSEPEQIIIEIELPPNQPESEIKSKYTELLKQYKILRTNHRQLKEKSYKIIKMLKSQLQYYKTKGTNTRKRFKNSKIATNSEKSLNKYRTALQSNNKRR